MSEPVRGVGKNETGHRRLPEAVDSDRQRKTWGEMSFRRLTILVTTVFGRLQTERRKRSVEDEGRVGGRG